MAEILVTLQVKIKLVKFRKSVNTQKFNSRGGLITEKKA